MNMPKRLLRRIVPLGVTLFMSVGAVVSQAKADIFSVKDYEATGKKADNARTAIQKAIDACAKAGGGIVYLPPGDYTSGTIHLRSHVRFWIEAGATLFSAEEDAAFDTDGLLFGEDLINIDRKSTRLNSSHGYISYAVFCLKKKKKTHALLLACYHAHRAYTEHKP